MSHSHWTLVARCAPMAAVVAALIAIGPAGAGLVVVALICTAAMALTMRGMSHHGHGGKRGSR